MQYNNALTKFFKQNYFIKKSFGAIRAIFYEEQENFRFSEDYNALSFQSFFFTQRQIPKKEKGFSLRSWLEVQAFCHSLFLSEKFF